MNYSALDFSELIKFKRNKLIIWRDYEQVDEICTYEDVIKVSREITTILNKARIAANERIGLMLDHSPHIIALIISILNYSCSFCTILPQNIKIKNIDICLRSYGARYLFSDYLIQEESSELELLKEVKVFKRPLYLYAVGYDSLERSNLVSLCYSIQTSGSTSEPKIVHVPFDCIIPNIENLSKIFSITAEDVIFVASPPTFDPFVVDVLLALRSGAALLMVPKHLRCNLKLLPGIICPKDDTGATILQITPSVFKHFGKTNIKDIFRINSSLRIIALGGEPFPDLEEVKFWQDWSCERRKRIFNIYGITELSCWSTLEEITDKTTEVTLGTPIDDSTILEVRDTKYFEVVSEGIGQLFIGSKIRRCLIDNESPSLLLSDKIIFRSTGDIVSINDRKIIYSGRIDSMVKRFGHRVDLNKIESTICEHKSVSDACCVFWRKRDLLIIFYTGTNVPKKNEMRTFLIDKLKNYEIPDDLVQVDALPLSDHGKLSRLKLLHLYKSKVSEKNISRDPIDILKAFISEALDRSQDVCEETNGPTKKKNRLSWDCSFISAGGTSFQALQLCGKLEPLLIKNSNSEVLRMLLDEYCPLNKVLEEVEKAKNNSHPLVRECFLQMSNDFSLKISWKFNLGKCVDASPAILVNTVRSIVSVGSHSHLLANLSAKSGELISSLTLPDRLEGQVAFLTNTIGIVGSYNGFLYKYNLESGSVIWSFNSCGLIKCKPLIVLKRIVFGNYADAENLFCLDEEGKKLWSLKIATKGIYSSPVALDNTRAIVCSLDGTTVILDIESANILWKKRFSSPIFSTCSILPGECFLLAEVNGSVHCINCHGYEVFSFKADGSIFSSFEIIQHSERRVNALFGCHDRNLYCLEIIEGKMFLKWKTNLQAQVFSTPKLIQCNDRFLIISCSTNGFVNLVDLVTGSLLTNFKLGGEIFSSPCVDKDLIFVGCRDDNLYCITVDSSF